MICNCDIKKCLFRFFGFGFEVQGKRIDAIALSSCFPRTIIEDMPQVCPTISASHFRSSHEERVVFMQLDVLHVDWIIEARPPGA
jgi:hypothetical protein